MTDERERLTEATAVIAGMVRLSEMGLEASLKEPEEDGNYAAYNRAKRFLTQASTQPVSKGAEAAQAFNWLANCDNLILFNGDDPDGSWEVRRGNTKGQVRGRGQTPLDAVKAAMLVHKAEAANP